MKLLKQLPSSVLRREGFSTAICNDALESLWCRETSDEIAGIVIHSNGFASRQVFCHEESVNNSPILFSKRYVLKFEVLQMFYFDFFLKGYNLKGILLIIFERITAE